MFSDYLVDIAAALGTCDGDQLAHLLRLDGQRAHRLLREIEDTSPHALARYEGAIVSPWDEIAIAHVQAVAYCADSDAAQAYRTQRDVAQFFITTTNWCLPALYAVLEDLRDIAHKADFDAFEDGKAGLSMEDAARVCNKAFSNCVTDRTSPYAESRKWGIYYVVGLVLKCYFKINRISLSRNVIRAIKAQPDIPPLEAFPRSHQVTFRYYLGMLSFLNEDYQQAEAELSFAFYNCHQGSPRNQERALTYLIPLRMMCGQLPSPRLLSRFDALNELFAPFAQAIRQGDLKAYDAALATHETRLADIGLLLTVEKARDICMRGLFRRVWLASDNSTRIPVSHFHAALLISGSDDIPVEEAECLVANMIFKSFIRGYVSHEKQMVVLASTSAFPQVDKTMCL